ncbi:MAG: hypothetical protein ACK4NY_09135 [Spirosomataceae bacterium]
MSLETVLHIGKKLREAKDNLRYFKAVEICPKDKDGTYPICFNIPVKSDFTFDWDNMGLVPENKQSQLYYLKYKSSGNDSGMKYVFGDIYFQNIASIDRDGIIKSDTGGYFKLNNPAHPQAFQRKNSIDRGLEDFGKILELTSTFKTQFEAFHNSIIKDYHKIEAILKHGYVIEQYILEKNEESLLDYINDKSKLREDTIEFVLKSISKSNLKKLGIIDEHLLDDKSKEKLYELNNSSIFLHFEFENEKHWYELSEIFKAIKTKMFTDFSERTTNGLVLTKTLYKTLCSGDDSNDIQFPKFTNNNKHKAKSFDDDNLEDLFYAVDFASKGRFIKGTDIKMIVLPLGKNLQEQDYIDFLQNRDEGQVTSKNTTIEEPLFSFLEENNSSITSFDLIFSKKGAGAGTPDTDLIEISGIEKSKLQMTMKRIRDISSSLMSERKAYLKTKKDLFEFKIENSFQNILGTSQYDEKSKKVSIKANPKYESHLLKVLPKIYTDTYTHDEILLPAFIQNIEYSVRSGDEKFTFFQFDLKFFYKIQNSNNDKFTDMINSESYQIGLKLGKLAKPLKKKINAFEKRYVGLLTRHTSTKDDCIKFANDIHEMLTRHEKTWGQMSAEVSAQIANIEQNNYDKEKLAFGFFEGYFKYEATDKKKDFINRIEKLLSDYEGNTELEDEIDKLQSLLDDLK